MAKAETRAATDHHREPEPPSAADEDHDSDEVPVTSPKDAAASHPKIKTRSGTKFSKKHDETNSHRHGHWTHAYFVGRTREGRMLFRLPSGEIVARSPRYLRTPAIIHRRVYYAPPGPPPGYVPPPPYGYPPPGY